MKFENINKVLKEFKDYVVEEAKQNLNKDKMGGGDLYNSIRGTLDDEERGFIVNFLMEEYGAYQDEGVRGADPSLVDSKPDSPYSNRKGVQKAPLSKFKYKSKPPPLDVLVDWAKRKNVRFRVRKGNKGAGQFKKGSYKQMGFWLQKSIYAQGLKPTYFFKKAFEAGLKKVIPQLRKEFALDIEKGIILGTKK